MTFTPIILVHIASALGAVLLGGLTLALPKGTPSHRMFGRLWVVLMALTALVSFGIRASGQFSWIHLLSVAALVGLVAAIYAAIRGNIRAHRRGMTSVYVSLVIAGIFTLLPQRRLGSIVLGAVGII